MKIINFKSVEKGYLRGFFDVIIEEWGMTMACSFFDKDGKKWVNLPSREYEKDGQKKYQALVKFDEIRQKKFQESVLALIAKGEYEEFVKKAPPVAAPVDDDCPF